MHGPGLQSIFPLRKLRPLGLGDVRYLASIEGPIGTRLCSCVQTADGLHAVKVPDEHHRDELLIPVFHVKVDQVSDGGRFFQWLV